MNDFVCVFRSQTGTTLKESCLTEPDKIGNVTNSLAIGVTNSSLDQDRLKSAISGLLMSEMANANVRPSFGPSVSLTTPPSSYFPGQQSQQPIIVVQPPAQQIYFNGMDGTLSRPIRSPNPGEPSFFYRYQKRFEEEKSIFFFHIFCCLCRLFPEL